MELKVAFLLEHRISIQRFSLVKKRCQSFDSGAKKINHSENLWYLDI